MNYPQGPGPYPPNVPPQHGHPQYGQPQGPYRPQYGQPQGPYQPSAPPPGPYQPQQQAPPFYPPHQPTNVQPYAAQGYQAAEGIAVTTGFFPLSFMLALFKPKIVVDGYEMPAAGWGRTVVPARPGPHHVHVHVPYWLPPQIGPADTTVDVYPGRLAELEYKAPVWGFSPGSLGAPPQSYNGVGISVGVMVAAMIFAVVLPIIMILAST